MKEVNSGKSAILFGATGLVGNELLKILCASERYASVKTFSRRTSGISNAKLTELINPLVDPNEISDEIKGDDLFCCLGTTIKKAGSREVFRNIDLELPVTLAKIAQKNQVKKFIVVSSVGANAGSRNFYLQTKGEMEKQVSETNIPDIIIVRPSMLLGKRNEFRFGEIMGKAVMKAFSPLLTGKLKKYRGIKAETVAMAMLNLANANENQEIFESDELEVWGKDHV